MKDKMDKIKEKFNDNRFKVGMAATVPAVTLGTSVVPVFANDGGGSGSSSLIDSTMTTALQNGFSSVQSDVVTIITTALPYALGVMALIVALTVGIRWFKKSAK